ncbi:MAG: hypothetical protein WC965_01515 [Thiohalomonadaceae bacterium]
MPWFEMLGAFLLGAAAASYVWSEFGTKVTTTTEKVSSYMVQVEETESGYVARAIFPDDDSLEVEGFGATEEEAVLNLAKKLTP